MEPTDLFREKLRQELERMPRGSKAKLAKYIGISPGHLSDYLGGRKPIHETKRYKAAEFLGIPYDGMVSEQNTDPEGGSVETRPPPKAIPDTATPEQAALLKDILDFMKSNGDQGFVAIKSLLDAAKALSQPHKSTTRSRSENKSESESGRERNGNHLNLASENQQAHT